MLIGPTIRRRRLGADLRALRETRSLKLEEVASHLGVAPSTLSRIETGKAPTRTSYLAMMLDLYEVTDPARRRAYMDLAREGQRKGWWADCDELLPAGAGTYLGLEAEASALRAFQSQVVHDLAQTPEYARAVLTASRPELTAEQVERLAAVQVRRQEVLGRAEPIELTMVLDESVLLRTIGSPAVMADQLEHLVRLAARPAVTVRVLSLADAARQALTGSFAILSFADPGDAEVLCAEGVRGQITLEERVSEVAAMAGMFDAHVRAAMPPEHSAKLIAKLAARL